MKPAQTPKNVCAYFCLANNVYYYVKCKKLTKWVMKWLIKKRPKKFWINMTETTLPFLKKQRVRSFIQY